MIRGQEVCESGGGRPVLPVPNNPYGFCGCKATLKKNIDLLLKGENSTLLICQDD